MSSQEASTPSTVVAVLMGVSGVGKTAVGTRSADRMGWEFYDGDDFHSEANVRKMRSGTPLNDDDRSEWLETLSALIHECLKAGRSAVVACSALKKTYQKQLLEGNDGAVIVYLQAEYEVVEARIRARRGHYFDGGLLDSQYAALEEPREAITIDATRALDDVVDDVVTALERAAAPA